MPGCMGRSYGVYRTLLLLSAGQRSAYFDRPGLRIVERDLRADDWATASATRLRRSRQHHADWLTRTELTAVYTRWPNCCARGVLITATTSEGGVAERLQHIARTSRTQAERVGVSQRGMETWCKPSTRPGARDLAGERGAKPLDHSVLNHPPLDDTSSC